MSSVLPLRAELVSPSDRFRLSAQQLRRFPGIPPAPAAALAIGKPSPVAPWSFRPATLRHVRFLHLRHALFLEVVWMFDARTCESV